MDINKWHQLMSHYNEGNSKLIIKLLSKLPRIPAVIPSEMPEQMLKEEAKELLAEIEVQIKEYKVWTDADSEACLMISSMVQQSARQRVMENITSKQLWEALQTEFETKGPCILEDYKITTFCKISDYKTAGEYVKAVTEAASRLNQMDFLLPTISSS